MALTNPVRPFLRAVANGRHGETARITIVATPEPADGAPDAFELSEWPREMFTRLRDGRFSVANRPWGWTLGIRPAATQAEAEWPEHQGEARRAQVVPHEAVTPLWKAVFEAELGEAAWGLLRADIGRSLNATKHAADLSADAPPAATLDRDGAILSDRPKPTDTATIGGVVPVAQGSLALQTEAIRAARILAKQQNGPRRFDDDREDTARAAEQPSPDAPALEPNDHVAAHQALLTKALRDTQTARGIAAGSFDAVTKALKGASASMPVSARPALVPPAEHVCDGNADCPYTASHAYGTWLQRQSNQVWKDDKPPCIADNVDASCDPAEAEHRIYANFYALQGDPTLSRLFGLAFDLEVPIAELGDARDVHLRADQCDDPTLSPAVVTAARLDADAFWPFSVFDGGTVWGSTTPALNRPDLVEQRAGIWSVGQVGPDCAPRYDLVSLDMRRAVDGQAERRDRGERHGSAGLCLVDHGRGAQVVRDLALSALHADTVKVANAQTRRIVLLHAEELTVGRRVDVTAAAPNAATAGLTGWRSLMHRTVRFEFVRDGGRLREALGALLDQPGAATFLEETSFQVTGRFVPRPDERPGKTDGSGTNRHYDVLPDEAVFLWDGTPAAVLTGAQAALPVAGSLPFHRVFGLPDHAAWPRLRPPPLRYGIPYAVGLRSTFLGGGSPTPEEARIDRGRDDDLVLPAACGGRAVPRRFLRHDGIRAPVLLFPSRLALARHPMLGFEDLDKAIVRSAGGAATAEDRAAPAETVRVFVAPEAAQDTVVRHGMLDGRDSEQVRRGGLLGVEYRAHPEEGTTANTSGFPMVVAERVAGFGVEPVTIRRRELPASATVDPQTGETSQAGMPVFRPGANTARAPHGYLPDPAADRFCLRARRRGCDLYLEGCLEAELYDQPARIAFPHALPLVLTIVRVSAMRPVQARAIGELLRSSRLAHMRADERVVDDAPRGAAVGVRVRHIVLELMQGEDFDLEVTCLPSVATLERTFAVPETIALQLAAANRSELEALCNKELPLPPAKLPSGLTGLGGAALPSIDALHSAADGLVQAMCTKWPIEEIAAVTRLRICHALARPALAPIWLDREEDAEPVKLRRPADASGRENQRGATLNLLDGRIAVDLEHVSGFEIVAETTASHGAPLDDPTRGRSLIDRRSGRWPFVGRDGVLEQSAAVVGFDVTDDRVTLPRERVTLLRVSNLPTHGAHVDSPPFGPVIGRLTTLDLLCLHDHAIAGQDVRLPAVAAPSAFEPVMRTLTVKTSQPNVIADTLARQLDLSIVAFSRTASLFTTSQLSGAGDRAVLRPVHPLDGLAQSIVGGTVRALSPATRRPAACAPLLPEPSFVVERTAWRDGAETVRRMTRLSHLRLWLGRGRLSSGEGERLGIVLYPPAYFEQADDDIDKDLIKLASRPHSMVAVSDLQDADLGPGGAFVSRWGGDPIRMDGSPQTGNLIPPSAFLDAAPDPHWSTSPHRPLVVACVPMPVGSDKGTANAPTLDVTLLTYEPCFDLEREAWFVDVHLRPNRASEPVARLGLVHYQANAIEADVCTSFPSVATAPLLPKRVAEVRLSTGGDWRLTARVHGLGSLGIQDLHPETLFAEKTDGAAALIASFERLKRPIVRLVIFHESFRGPLLVRVEREEAACELTARIVNNKLVWESGPIVVAREWLVERGPGMMVAAVQEADRRMSASPPGEPITREQMFDPANTHEAPRFLGRIPIGRHDAEGRLVEDNS